MSKWDEMDRKVWDNSEVMKNFEERILNRVKDLERIVQAQQNMDTQKQKLQEVNQEATKVKESLQQISEMTADDGEVPESTDKADWKDIKEEHDAWRESVDAEETISNDQHNEAQDSLMKELKTISEAAADAGNIKLAYMIERTISEIFGE